MKYLQRAILFISFTTLPVAAFVIFSFFSQADRFFSFLSDSETTLVIIRILCTGYLIGAIYLFIFKKKTILKWGEFLERDYRTVTRCCAFESTPDRSTLVPTVLSASAIMIGSYSMYLAFFDVPAFSQFIKEDGIIETMSWVSWLCAAAFSCISLTMDKRMVRTKLLTYLPLIFFFILCGGEEMSWGQRLFHLHSPEALVALNKQKEINLHDIGSISIYENLFFLINLFVFLVIPFLLKKIRGLRSYFHYYNTPIMHPECSRIFLISLAIWIIVGIRFGTIGFSPMSLWGYYNQMDDEIFEFFTAFCFMSFALLDFTCRLNSSARRQSPSVHSGSKEASNI